MRRFSLCYNMEMRRYILLALLGLAFANWVAWGYVLEGSHLKVTFFDVGQGDASFIETPQGHQILIDGGRDSKIVEKLEQFMAPSDKTIDLVLLSHPASDHVTGLLSVLKEY